MSNVQFCERLIKGKIAEVIFEQMFRESGRYTIIHYGYEYTLPELAQFRKSTLTKNVANKIVKNISKTPDFILISQDKSAVFLIEVKYEASLDKKRVLEIAQSQLQRWDTSWLFVASHKHFFFDTCKQIVTNKGNIKQLGSTWATAEIQKEYLKLLNKYERMTFKIFHRNPRFLTPPRRGFGMT